MPDITKTTSVNRIYLTSTTVGTFGPYDVSAFRQTSVQTRLSNTGTLIIKKTNFANDTTSLVTQTTITTSTFNEYTTQAKHLYLNVSALSGTIEAVLLLGN